MRFYHNRSKHSSINMKFIAVFVLAFVGACVAGPISVSDNNIGDIITVGVRANLEISNQVEQNIISVIVALLNQELGIIRLPEGGPSAPNLPSIPEEWRDRIREILDRIHEGRERE